MDSLKLAVVTGSNKGIGFGIVAALVQKAYRVVMACRSLQNAETARKELLEKLKVEGDRLETIELDVSSSSSIDKFIAEFGQRFKQADVLINNAGMAFKGDRFDEEVVRETFQTNFYGTVELTEKFLPYIRNNGKIVTLGSQAGLSRVIKGEELRQRYLKDNLTRDELFQLAKEFHDSVADGSFESKGWGKSGYGTSKLHINLYHRILARHPDVIARNIQVYVCCPGYVNTDMTSHKGHLTIEEGADTPVWLTELPNTVNPDYQGKMFYKREVIQI